MIAAGGQRLFTKLKDILTKMEDAVAKFAEQAGNVARHAVCQLVGGCFVLGTVVAADGQGFIPIEDVVVGAAVDSSLPNAFPGVAPADSQRIVVATWLREYEGALHTLCSRGLMACAAIRD